MQCTHTHILLFGSKFHIILAMYVQMLDICIKNIEKVKNIEGKYGIFLIFSKISQYFPTLQPGLVAICVTACRHHEIFK